MPEPTIAVVTALPKEHSAVSYFIQDPQTTPIDGDPTIYTTGFIEGSGGRHKIVLACQSKYANNLAAVTVTNVIRSFPSVQDVIFVGIAAGVPRPDKPSAHVRLGDIVVSSGRGVVQFDLGAHTPEGFEIRDTSPPPSARLLQAANMLESESLTGSFSWPDFLRDYMQAANIRRPRREPVHSFEHPRDPERIPGIPRIFRGKIGASNAVIRNSEVRDKVAIPLGLLAIEMEGSGIADATWEANKGYLLIRCACDYGDANKMDAWHRYSAQMAAAYFAALLRQLPAPREGSPVGGTRGNLNSPVRTTAAKTGILRSTNICPGRLTCCTWRADELAVFTGGFDHILYQYDLGTETKPLANIGPSILRVISRLTDPPSLLVGDDAGKLTLIPLNYTHHHEVGTTKSSIYSIVPNQRTRTVFTAERGGLVTEWDTRSLIHETDEFPRLTFLRILHEHHGAAFAVRHDTLQDRCISVGEDGVVRYTDLPTGHTYERKLSDAALFALAIGTTRPLLATGGSDGAIRILDQGGSERTLKGHTDTVRSIDISPACVWIATGSKDKTLRLWHLSTGRVWLLAHMPDYLYEVAFSPSGRVLAVVDGAGNISTIDFNKPIDSFTQHDMDGFA